MSKRHNLWAFFVWLPLLGLTAAWGQDSSPSSRRGVRLIAVRSSLRRPTARRVVRPSITENPPISGLDMPNLEPHAAPFSYFRPGAHLSESVSSNLQNALGGSNTYHLGRVGQSAVTTALEQL